MSSIKSILSKPFAKWVTKKVLGKSLKASEAQTKVMESLVTAAAATLFGKDHNFEEIDSYADFKKHVPIRGYEELKPYVERVKAGEENILWPGVPMYLCKTSGTTSGAKYIPLTKESLPNHLNSARNALLAHIAHVSADFIGGKMIFLQGSPTLDQLESGVNFGRLSGIVAHHVPKYLQKNRMPSYETNCIEDWETKVDKIVEETSTENMTLISGIPSWVQMYFERLLEFTGKATVKEVFPNFNLFVYGGVNYEPYREKFKQLIGEDIPSIELYPASEGFIAYQDTPDNDGLLLNVDSGIFFEFIPADRFFDPNPPRLDVSQVEVGVNYALIINNNAGLWGYSIGDTVKFVSMSPPRIKVTGRIKHFTSAFGEHVIAEEVERAMSDAQEKFSMAIGDFHVAPELSPSNDELPFHEWLVEFEDIPANLDQIAAFIDRRMCEQNTYYDDLISGNVLQKLKITPLPKGAFLRHMKRKGKLGGQNKVPRLSNDREMANSLLS